MRVRVGGGGEGEGGGEGRCHLLRREWYGCMCGSSARSSSSRLTNLGEGEVRWDEGEGEVRVG